MDANFLVVQAVLIDLGFDKDCTYVLQSIVYEHYSLQKHDLLKVKV